MEQIKESLDNLNINSYYVDIAMIPYLNYKCKSVSTPSVTLNSVPSPTPFQAINVPGDKLTYGTLSITLLIDENLYNYTSILNWMEGLGFPNSFDEFKKLIADDTEISKKTFTRKETSDMTVHFLTNHRNTNRILKLASAFPISLSGIEVNNSNTESEVIEATVEFVFTGMKFLIGKEN